MYVRTIILMVPYTFLFRVKLKNSTIGPDWLLIFFTGIYHKIGLTDTVNAFVSSVCDSWTFMDHDHISRGTIRNIIIPLNKILFCKFVSQKFLSLFLEMKKCNVSVRISYNLHGLVLKWSNDTLFLDWSQKILKAKNSLWTLVSSDFIHKQLCWILSDVDSKTTEKRITFL